MDKGLTSNTTKAGWPVREGGWSALWCAGAGCEARGGFQPFLPLDYCPSLPPYTFTVEHQASAMHLSHLVHFFRNHTVNIFVHILINEASLTNNVALVIKAVFVFS